MCETASLYSVFGTALSLPSPSCDDLGSTSISLLEEGLLLAVSVVEVV